MNKHLKPNTIVITRVKPERIEKRGEEWHWIDFGKDAFGTLELSCFSETERTIEICLGEKIDSEGHLVEAEMGAPTCNRRFRRINLRLKPGKHTYRLELPRPYQGDGYQQKGYDCAKGVPCDPELGEIMPFRYCEIRGLRETLGENSVAQLMAHAPFDDSAADFTCSDERLNNVWEFCKHTIKATTCFGVYVDGDRERLPYAGDAWVNQLSHFCLDTNYEVASNTIEWFCEKGTSWCYEFQMIVPQLAWHYYLYSGDKELLRKYYDLFKTMTLADLTRSDGMLVTGNRLEKHPLIDIIRPRNGWFDDVIDWPINMRDGYEIGSINTTANSFHFSALRVVANIAECLGENGDAAMFRDKSRIVSRRMREVLMNRVSGLFVDSEGSLHSSIHANMMPLAHGAVKPQEAKEMIEFLESKGMACSVWGAQFLLEALCLGGKSELALKLLTADDERSWLGMLRAGATMTMEAWSDEDKPNQDWNHAWATSPTNIISRYFMGVRPLAPGYRKAMINPQPGGLEYAKISVPTIHGPINVEFECSNGKYEVKTNPPDGIEIVEEN